MSDLENHFGDDASIDEGTNRNILAFLVKNSAEESTMQASWNFLNSIGDKDIRKDLITQPDVKGLFNCMACHTTADKGIYSERAIRIPNYGKWED